MAFTDMVKGLLNWHQKYNNDFKDVHTELANKASISQAMPYVPTDDLNDLSQGVAVVIPGVLNSPNNNNFFGTAIAFKSVDWAYDCQFAFGAGANGVLYMRTKQNDIYTAWRPVASAEYTQGSLLAASGINSDAIYEKDGLGRVLVTGKVYTSGAITSGMVFATLPEGFRPSRTWELPATYLVSGTGTTAGSIAIKTDGTITASFSGGGNATYVFFCVQFRAA